MVAREDPQLNRPAAPSKATDQPAEIRHEIEVTRARIDRTIDVLQERLSPSYLAQQTMDSIKYRSKKTGNRLVNLISDNPVPAILTGVGLAWLISSSATRRHEPERRRFRGGRHEPRWGASPEDELRAQNALYEAGLESQGSAYEEYEAEGERIGRQSAGESTTGAAREKAAELGSQAREQARAARERAAQVGERVSRRASQMGEQVRHQASDVSHRVAEQASAMGRQVRHGARATQETAQEAYQSNPVLVGLGVLAAGMIAGLMLPISRRENRLMGEQRNHLFESAREYGEDMLERGQAVAQHAMEAAREEASEQGLTPGQLKQEGKQVAAAAKEAAQEEAKKQDLPGKKQEKPGGESSQPGGNNI